MLGLPLIEQIPAPQFKAGVKRPDQEDSMRIILGLYVVAVVMASLVSTGGTCVWHLDRIGVFLAYAGMAMLVQLTFDTSAGRLFAFVGAASLGAVLALVQSYASEGDASLLDGVVNTAGVITGAAFFGLYEGIRTRMAVRLLASEVDAEAKACRVSSRCGEERLEARFKYRGYRTRISAGRLVCVQMKGFESSVAFALGAPDPQSLMHDQIASPPVLGRLPLFINASLAGPTTADWLASEDNVRALAILGPTRREPLFVYHGGLVTAVRPGRATLDTLSRLADIAKQLEAGTPKVTSDREVDGLRINPSLLPADLWDLVPLIEMWAVGDDLERQELLEEASPEELDQLVKTVGPLMDRINEYLDSFAWDEVPEEAALVGRLAEAVAQLGG